MRKLWRSSWLVVLLCCFLFCHKVAAAEDVSAVEPASENEVVAVAESADGNKAIIVAEPETGNEGADASEYVPVVRQEVGIVMLGSSRYLQPAYQDILNRFFVRCYSQYRFPTEFGKKAQQKFAYAYASLAKNEENQLTKNVDENLPLIVERMGKDQVLFLWVADRVHRKWRRWGPFFGSETMWDAYVQVTAVLADKNGILKKEKVFRWVDEQYTPSRALTEAYTYCIRTLQRKKLFEAPAKTEKIEGEVKADEI